LDKNLKYILYI